MARFLEDLYFFEGRRAGAQLEASECSVLGKAEPGSRDSDEDFHNHVLLHDSGDDSHFTCAALTASHVECEDAG